MAGAATAAIERLETAIIALDGQGRVLLANPRAEVILREQDGLVQRSREISTTDAGQVQRFRQLVRHAVDTGAGRGSHSGGVMLVERIRGSSLHVCIMPFRSGHTLAELDPCAMIFIRSADQTHNSRASILRTLYKLTPSECRLADALLQDADLQAAAARIRVTRETARFMIKSIFRKTVTRGQPELIRFLINLPGDHVVGFFEEKTEK